MSLLVHAWHLLSRAAVVSFWVLMLLAIIMNSCVRISGGYDAGYEVEAPAPLMDARAEATTPAALQHGVAL